MSGVIDRKLRKDVTMGGKNLKLTPPGSTGRDVGSIPMGDTVGNKATKRLLRQSKSQERTLRSGFTR